METKKTIKIRKDVWKQLTQMKINEGFRSLEDVIASLFEKAKKN